MAQIIIEIADETYPEVEQAFVDFFNYQTEIDDGSGLNVMIPNPETKEALIVRKLKVTIADIVRYARQKREGEGAIII